MVLHAPHGVEVVKQMAKLVYGLGYNLLVLSKPTSAAAQTGVPEASRLAFKLGRGLLIVPDIKDAIELIQPTETLFFVENKKAEPYREEDVCLKVKSGDTVALFFSGLEPGFSAKETEHGKAVRLNLPGEVGCIGLAAIVLYGLRQKLLAL